VKKRSLSPRLVEHMVGLLALAFLAVGLLLYAFDEPQRIESAQAAQRTNDLDEAMTLYAQNCAVCHGLAGEGIGATPALNRDDLRSADAQMLTKVISSGLYSTSMPAWSKEDGGPLSDYQIATLITLIQIGDWGQTQDQVVNLGLAPLVPFTTQPDQALLEQAKALPGGDILALGIQIYAAQCVACHGADGLGTNLAPALNDPALRAKDAAEITLTIQNGVPKTLMSAWGDTLSEEETVAVTALITRWGEVPGGAIPAPDKPVPVTAESLQLGADLYAQSCARCHAAEGQGTRRAPSLNVKSYLEETNDSALQQIISLGVPGTAMPAWGDRLTDAEIQAIVGFIRSWEPTAPEVAAPARGGGGPWWATEGGTRPGGPGAMPSGGFNPNTDSSLQDVQPGAEATLQSGVALTGIISSTAQSGENVQAGVSIQSPGNGQGNTHTATGESGPPWARSEPAPWWESLDWRTAGLAGGLLAISTLLIGMAVFGLAGVNKGAEIPAANGSDATTR